MKCESIDGDASRFVCSLSPQNEKSQLLDGLNGTDIHDLQNPNDKIDDFLSTALSR